MLNRRRAPQVYYALVVIVSFITATQNQSLCLAKRRAFLPLGFSGVASISDDGLVVAGEAGESPYIWTEASGLETIPLQTGQELFSVTDISGDGTTVVGGLQIGDGFFNRHYESFSWTKQGGVKLLGRLPGNNYDWAFATAVSYDGSVVVGTDRSFDGLRAYRWTEATGQVELGTLGTPIPSNSPFSEATGVSATGDTVVGFIGRTDDGGYKAFRWSTTDGLEVIGLPGWPSRPNPYGSAYQISGDGQVIYGRDQNTGAWLWTEPEGFVLLPRVADQADVFVRALSHDRSTLVGNQFCWDTTPPFIHNTEAAIWRKTTTGYEMLNVAYALLHQGIDLQGWRLTDVVDVSADGRTLIGTGVSPQGVVGSWYAVLDGVLVPEPASAAMAFGAFLASVSLARRSISTSRRFRRS